MNELKITITINNSSNYNDLYDFYIIQPIGFDNYFDDLKDS